MKELIRKNRSYRRFYEEETLTKETLLELVDYARLSASGGNKQALRYAVVCDKTGNELIYPTLAWAGYLADWPGPDAGERPTGYIILLQDANDKMIGGIDHGIAAQSILLGATEAGLGGCMIVSVQRDKLKAALTIPEQYEILLVIALGKPKETVVLETVEAGGDIKYWRDKDQVHHVPKRKLEDIIVVSR